MSEKLFEVNINNPRYSQSLKNNGGRFFSERQVQTTESRLHYHNFYELEIILKGSSIQQLDGNSFELKRGTVTLISPNQVHYIEKPSEPMDIISIKITPEAINEELSLNLSVIEFPIIGLLTEKQLSLFLKIYESIKNKEILTLNSSLEVEAITCQINSFIYFIMAEFGDICINSYDSSNRLLFKTIRYVKQNILKPITLKQAAEEFGYSPNYFSAKFKQLTGKGFAAFVQDERLLLAYRAICTTDKSLTCISEECGFESFPYFSRVFKQKYGKSPVLFRERKNKKS